MRCQILFVVSSGNPIHFEEQSAAKTIPQGLAFRALGSIGAGSDIRSVQALAQTVRFRILDFQLEN